MQATDGRLPWDTRGRIAAHWPIQGCAIASLALAVALAAFLIERRWSGNVVAPLPPPQLVVAAVVLTLWAFTIRVLLPLAWTISLTAVVLWAFAAAFSFPAERAVDWIVWLTAFGVLIAGHQLAPPFSTPGPRPIPRRKNERPQASRLRQQISRFRTTDGHDEIVGMLVAEFAPGQRFATLHVSFCPPLERLPQIEVNPTRMSRSSKRCTKGPNSKSACPRSRPRPHPLPSSSTPATATRPPALHRRKRRSVCAFALQPAAMCALRSRCRDSALRV